MTYKIDKNDYFYDNIKFILIFIVVVGHYCEKYSESILLNSLFNFIYSFHMPLFIFLSGYFSKNIESQRIKDVTNLIIPYLIIQVLYFAILALANPNYNWSLLLPIGANWYLLGLFVWRMLAPYFRHTKYALYYAIGIGLLIGLLPDLNQTLNLQRIFTYLPFFIFGYQFTGNYKEKLLFKSTYFQLIFWIIFVLFVVSGVYFPDFISVIKKWEITLYPYTGNLPEKLYQLFGRFMFYLMSVIISFLFLQMIPDRKTRFSELGKNSLYVFLFHMFFIYFLVAVVPYKYAVTELLAIPVSIILTLILSSKFVVSVLELIIYPWKIKEKFYLRKK
jgi:fucose 4-O-acetylase-like acetyltransferase